MKVSEKHRSEKVYWGKEPEWDDQVITLEENSQKTLLGNALNWYNAMSTAKQQKKWVLDYIKRNEIETQGPIHKLEDGLFYPYGGLVRILIRGGTFPDEMVKNKVLERISLLNELAPNEIEREKTPEEKLKEIDVKVDDPIVDAAVETIEIAIDAFINDGSKILFDFKSLMESHSANRSQAKVVAAHFLPLLTDIRAILAGDKELKAGYGISIPKIRQLETVLADIINTSQSYVAPSAKKQRKPRRKKVKKPTEQVKSVEICESFKIKRTTYKSIPMKQIVGSQIAVIWDVKYNKLGIYKAENSDGFKFKGSTLQNFNADTSICKRIRPNQQQDVLKTATSGGKVALRKLLPGVNAKEIKLTGRFNKNIALLRVL